MNEEAVDPLLRALTAPGTCDELAGEQAAIAQFRAVRSPRTRQARRLFPSVGVTAAAAGLAALVFAGGAYSAVLPGPIQHMAHKVLSPIGVPDAGRKRAVAERTARPSPSVPGPVPLPVAHRSNGPAPSEPYLAAGRPELPAGGNGTLTARIPLGRGVAVQLFAQAAGTAGWRQVATAVTGPGGQVTFGIRRLTRNTEFRVVTPGQPPSAPVLITVLPRLALVITSGTVPGTVTVTVIGRYAESWDLVLLEILVRGRWETIAQQQLGPAGKTAFVVAVGQGQAYRIELRATTSHGGATAQVGTTR